MHIDVVTVKLTPWSGRFNRRTGRNKDESQKKSHHSCCPLHGGAGGVQAAILRPASKLPGPVRAADRSGIVRAKAMQVAIADDMWQSTSGSGGAARDGPAERDRRRRRVLFVAGMRRPAKNRLGDLILPSPPSTEKGRAMTAREVPACPRSRSAAAVSG